MELPLSASATLAYFSSTSGMVNYTNNAGAPAVISVLDRAGNVVAKQLTTAKQPTLGTVDGAGPVKYSALQFDGSDDVLTCNALAANLVAENAKLDFTVFVVAETASFASSNLDLFTLGKSASDGYIRLSISGSKAAFSAKDDSAVVSSGSGGTVDAKVHTYALVKDATAGTITVYLDGTSVASASATGAFTPDTCSIGALVDNSTTANFYNGRITEVAVFKGKADLTAISTYFSQKYTATLG